MNEFGKLRAWFIFLTSVNVLTPGIVRFSERHTAGNDYLQSVSPLSTSGCAKGGGVRFTEEPPSAGAASHVHFEEKLHDSVVMVTPEEDGHFMVKVRSGLALLRVAESAVRGPMSRGDFGMFV